MEFHIDKQANVMVEKTSGEITHHIRENQQKIEGTMHNYDEL